MEISNGNGSQSLYEKGVNFLIRRYMERGRMLGSLSTSDGLIKYKDQLQIPESELSTNYKILDVGSGIELLFPRETIKNYPNMYGLITSLDTDFPNFSRKQRELFQHEGIDPVRGNVFHLKFGNETFDRVYSNNSISLYLSAFPDMAVKAIAEMLRVTKQGGLIRISPVDEEMKLVYANFLDQQNVLTKYSDQKVRGPYQKPDPDFQLLTITKN